MVVAALVRDPATSRLKAVVEELTVAVESGMAVYWLLVGEECQCENPELALASVELQTACALAR